MLQVKFSLSKLGKACVLDDVLEMKKKVQDGYWLPTIARKLKLFLTKFSGIVHGRLLRSTVKYCFSEFFSWLLRAGRIPFYVL